MLAAKLVIGDGDALQVAGAGLDHEARQGAGVDAAGEEDADRDIGDQVAGDGFAQGLADVFADLGRGRDRGAVGLAPGPVGNEGRPWVDFLVVKEQGS